MARRRDLGVSHTSGDVPRIQPGRRQSLSQFTYLDHPVSLDEIRSHGSSLRAALDELVETYGPPLYGPFELGQKRPVRPSQAYLTRMPASFVDILGLDGESPSSASGAIDDELQSELPGRPYIRANEQVMISDTDPFKRDPSIVEKSLRVHWQTQNALADHIEALGWEPLRPDVHEPQYDLAWQDGSGMAIAEVKSIRPLNEEKQLRLGLGQLLRYIHMMRELGHESVRGVIVVNQKPTDDSWFDLLSNLSIQITWAPHFRNME